MDIRDQRELMGGFGDTLARAFELAVTPLIFAGLGHLVDGRAGTGHLFTVVLAVLAVIGTLVKLSYQYVEDMKTHEANASWSRSVNVSPSPGRKTVHKTEGGRR